MTYSLCASQVDVVVSHHTIHKEAEDGIRIECIEQYNSSDCLVVDGKPSMTYPGLQDLHSILKYLVHEVCFSWTTGLASTPKRLRKQVGKTTFNAVASVIETLVSGNDA
jgi:hypothetical protein